MQINSLNSVSFSGEKSDRKANVKETKERIYRYISQSQVNDELKMSRDREVENGKYKLASTKALLGAFTGILGANMLVRSTAKKSMALQNAGKYTSEAAKKIGNKLKFSIGLAAASTIALFSSLAINAVNRSKANKTATDRGFFSDKEFKQIKSTEERMAVTDLIYNSHLS